MSNFQLFHITCKGLVFYKNRFLLHQEDNYKCPGSLECPGGRVNNNEPIETALHRELNEEIGLDLATTDHTMELFAINQRDTADYGFDDKTAIVEVYYKITIPDWVAFEPQTLQEVDQLVWIDHHTDLDAFSYEIASRKDIYRKAQLLLDEQ